MTAQDEERLADLLLEWDERREQGQDVTAVELCKDCPQLADELARRIRALKATSWLDQTVANSDESLELLEAHTSPRTLAGRYRLDELVAEGGFAFVWRAYDLELQRTVAVKMPKASRLQSAQAFMAEARRVARLNHPGIVSVYDVGQEDNACFIVSEFVEGGSLADHLVNNPPTAAQGVRWLIEAAEAAEFAHLHGIIHRDIKPANILIDQHNHALLADFGIAQSASRAGQQTLSLGTLRYMSPEQLEGKAVDPRSDVFSLGVVLHEAVTGKLPYTSVDPNVLRREIVSGVRLDAKLPPDIHRICKKALQRDPANRYASASQLAADLKRHIDNPRPQRQSYLGLSLIVLLIIGIAALLLSGYPAFRSEGSKDVDLVWIERVTKLLPEQQVNAVIAKLKELNPGFNGQVTIRMFDGVVSLLEMQTDDVTDISPLRALPNLQFVNLGGSKGWKHSGKLADISALKGMPLIELSLARTQVTDLSPLVGMPLDFLVLNHTPVQSLAPLRGMPLTRLDAHNTKVADLSPLEGMQLTFIHLANTQVTDLTPLTGMPIDRLHCQYTGLTSISPLAGMPLYLLEVHGNPISDLTPLQGSSVNSLNITGTMITDWSSLASMPKLETIQFDFVATRDMAAIQACKALKLINNQPIDEFWRTVNPPTTAKAALALADIDFENRRFSEAAENYSIALNLAPQNAATYDRRGSSYFNTGNYEKALADYDAAVKLDAGNTTYRMHQALTLALTNQHDAAIKQLKELLKQNPEERTEYEKNLARVYNLRASAKSLRKEFTEAARDMDEAIALFPDGPNYYHQRASCYFNLKEYGKAAEDFSEAIRRQPMNREHYLNRGYCYQALGKVEEAASDFENAKALETAPSVTP